MDTPKLGSKDCPEWSGNVVARTVASMTLSGSLFRREERCWAVEGAS